MLMKAIAIAKLIEIFMVQIYLKYRFVIISSKGQELGKIQMNDLIFLLHCC